MTKGELVELADAARKAGAEFRFGREVPDEDQLLSLYHAVNHNEPGNLADHFGDPDYPVRVAIRAAWLGAFYPGFLEGWQAATAVRGQLGDLVDGLTPAQQRILLWVAEGRPLAEIAATIGVKDRNGVQYHLRGAAKRKGMTMLELRREATARYRAANA